jgi:aspartate 1-decarboxylase
MITVLKSKIRALTIDVCRVEYEEGSITIPKEIMRKANINPYEKVEVNSKYGKGRITTYAIPGDRVEMNGGATNHFEEREVVHINVFKQVQAETIFINYKPIII